MTEKETRPIIGLAGGIGSGKSTIAKVFNTLGIQSVDADDVAREAVAIGSYCLEEIVKHFGESIILEDGTLNRKALRAIIFSDPSEKKWLESLTHPVIRLKIEKQLSEATSAYVLLVHPLLFETNQNTLCHLTVAIDTPIDTQRQRVIKRDKSPPEQVEKILASQLANNDRLSRADFNIENGGDIVDLNAKVLQLHRQILERLPAKEYNK